MIKRYRVNGSNFSVDEEEKGMLVLYTDYAKLEAENERLDTENSNLLEFDAKRVWDDREELAEKISKLKAEHKEAVKELVDALKDMHFAWLNCD